VIRLACLTEHRTDDEQRALVSWAWRCDVDNNKQTTVNMARWKKGWKPLDLVSLVMESRVHEGKDREVPPPKGWADRWERWARDEHLMVKR